MRRIPDYELWLGNHIESCDVRAVLNLGITAVVDLAGNELPFIFPRELVVLRFPLVDGRGNPPWMLQAAVNGLAGLLQSNVSTLMFCGAGMSRSPAIAAAAVAKVRDCRLAEALVHVVQSGPADVNSGLLDDLQAMVES